MAVCYYVFCSFSDNLNRRFGRVANQEQPMNGIQYWPFIIQLSCKACQQVYSLHMILFARNHQFHWQEARYCLSVQVRVMSKYLLRQTLKRKNLALSLQTGLRMKPTNFLQLGPPNSVRLRASQGGKIKIWNDIYSLYKERCPASQRTLQQVEKRQQILDNEFKQLKQRTRRPEKLELKRLKKASPMSTSFMR